MISVPWGVEVCWYFFHSVAERLPSEWPQGSEACVGAEFGTVVRVGVGVGLFSAAAVAT